MGIEKPLKKGLTYLALGISALTLNSCDDSPVGPGEPTNEPSSISWSPTQTSDKKETDFRLQVSDEDGLERVIARGTQNSSFFEEYDNINSNSLDEIITKTYDFGNESVVDVRYEITAFDSKGDETTSSYIVEVNPEVITNLEPEINVQVDYERNWENEEIRFNITAQDQFEDIDNIRLDFGDGNFNEFNVSSSSIDTTITHSYISAGEFDWQARATDTQGLQGTDSGLVDILGFYDVNIKTDMITYVGSLTGHMIEEDNSAEMVFKRRNSDFEVSMQAQNGLIQGSIPEGEYEVSFKSDASKLSRLRVDRDFYPDDFQYLSYMSVDGYEPGEKSWIIRGYESNSSYIGSDVNWYFDVSGDIDTRLETVKGAFVDAGHIHGLMFIPAYDFLKDMTGQMSDTGQLRTPRVKDVLGNEITTTMVYNYGNPAFDCSDWPQGGERPESCVSMKSVETGTIPVDSLPDGGLNPPGVIPRNPELAEQSFDEYHSIMQEIFNSEIVAGNPYDIEVVKGYSPELTDYMKSFYTPIGHDGTLLLINPEDDVFFTSHNWDAFTEYASTLNAFGNPQARYVNASMMFVASTLGGFQNEATHWFAVREGLPCTYSIRDSTKDDCGPLPNQFSEKDIVYNIIAASFGPYANIQKTDFERATFPNGNGNRDGFTTTLPRD